MKTPLKNRIIGALTALILTGTIAYAALTIVSGTLSSGVNLVKSGSVALQEIQLSDTSGSANTFLLYDNSSASSTNIVSAAYTARSTYSTNVIFSFTDPLGNTQYTTNTYLYSVNSTVAAATNEARRVHIVTVPANSTVIWTPDKPIGFTYGIQVKATGAGNYNANYFTLP